MKKWVVRNLDGDVLEYKTLQAALRFINIIKKINVHEKIYLKGVKE